MLANDGNATGPDRPAEVTQPGTGTAGAGRARPTRRRRAWIGAAIAVFLVLAATGAVVGGYYVWLAIMH